MDNTTVFNTFQVKVVDGKHKAEFVEMTQGELILLASNKIINKIEVVHPNLSHFVAHKHQHPLDLIANAPFGSVITLKVG